MAGTEITEVSGGTDLETVRALCRAFRRGQYERYPHEFDRIDRYYREEDFERTLAGLAEIHAPPGGVILLARLRGQPAGCVMLARVDGQAAR